MRTLNPTLEINGIGQHQPSQVVEYARLEQLLDLVLGLLLDPGVDGQAILLVETASSHRLTPLRLDLPVYCNFTSFSVNGIATVP